MVIALKSSCFIVILQLHVGKLIQAILHVTQLIFKLKTKKNKNKKKIERYQQHSKTFTLQTNEMLCGFMALKTY